MRASAGKRKATAPPAEPTTKIADSDSELAAGLGDIYLSIAIIIGLAFWLLAGIAVFSLAF